MNKRWEETLSRMKLKKKEMMTDKRHETLLGIKKKNDISSKIMNNNKSQKDSVHKERHEQNMEKQYNVQRQIQASVVDAENERLKIEEKNEEKSEYI